MDIEGGIRKIIEQVYNDGGTCNWQGTEYYSEKLSDLIEDIWHANLAYWTNEIGMLRQENEQLRVDLMISEEMFEAIPPHRNGVPMINIKRRSNFRNEK